MDSLDSSLQSPCVDFSKSVDNYTKLSNEVVKQLKEFEKRNADHRRLQAGLYKLLCQGDDLWDQLNSTGKRGSDGTAAQSLRRAIRHINENLADQDSTIDSLESSIKLSVKTFENLKESIKEVRLQHANVKENLRARVSAMKTIQPDLINRRSASQDSKNSRERVKRTSS